MKRSLETQALSPEGRALRISAIKAELDIQEFRLVIVEASRRPSATRRIKRLKLELARLQ